VVISNQQLRTAFLSPQMKCYFEKKLPDVSSAELDVRIEEALKFLNMATYCRGSSVPVSQEIDDIWHLWILETKEYEKLCTLLQGREFIHHRSNTYAECSGDGAEVPPNDMEHDVAMLANYVRNYGPLEEDRVKYWLFAAHLVNNGLTVDQLSQWLTSGTAAEGAAH
jgi:hypothetical protein